MNEKAIKELIVYNFVKSIERSMYNNLGIVYSEGGFVKAKLVDDNDNIWVFRIDTLKDSKSNLNSEMWEINSETVMSASPWEYDELAENKLIYLGEL